MARRPASGGPHDLFIFPPPTSAIGQQYYYVTQRPWPSLLFVLPGLVFFEVGSYLRSGESGRASQLVAPYLIQWLVETLRAGQGVPHLLAMAPGLLLVAVLLAWHLAAGHPWRIDLSVFAGMLGESMVYTVPLLVFMYVTRGLVLAAAVAPPPDWTGEFMMCFGAGIYEELVFRLACITLLVIVLIDVLRFPRIQAAVLIVAASALLFAFVHHPPVGKEPFDLGRFMFRTAAGLYFAGLFVFRGFGIAAGCHAFYNVIIVIMGAMRV
ncbi:MAG: CPBP family intramembrane metalloprotease [Phycisphaerae bacterium]|jgi:hypothetical protein